jgi:hypothetical protein
LGKVGTTGGSEMKETLKKEQKINLINCEKVPESEAFYNNSSQIRCSISVNIKFLEKKPQIVNIHQTESVVRIKQIK